MSDKVWILLLRDTIEIKFSKLSTFYKVFFILYPTINRIWILIIVVINVMKYILMRNFFRQMSSVDGSRFDEKSILDSYYFKPLVKRVTTINPLVTISFPSSVNWWQIFLQFFYFTIIIILVITSISITSYHCIFSQWYFRTQPDYYLNNIYLLVPQVNRHQYFNLLVHNFHDCFSSSSSSSSSCCCLILDKLKGEKDNRRCIKIRRWYQYTHSM